MGSAEQLSLDGMAESGRPTDRLFFALFPDPGTATLLGGLARRLKHGLGLRGRPLADERFHVTLHHLGDFAGLPEGLVASAREAAARVDVAPFQAGFDRAVSFHGARANHPFVLRADAAAGPLMAFQRELGLSLARAGLGVKTNATFTPHVTMLYDEQLVHERPVEPVRWTAHEFVLVHSLLDRTQHIPLGRWPLRERRG